MLADGALLGVAGAAADADGALGRRVDDDELLEARGARELGGRGVERCEVREAAFAERVAEDGAEARGGHAVTGEVERVGAERERGGGADDVDRRVAVPAQRGVENGEATLERDGALREELRVQRRAGDAGRPTRREPDRIERPEPLAVRGLEVVAVLVALGAEDGLVLDELDARGVECALPLGRHRATLARRAQHREPRRRRGAPREVAGDLGRPRAPAEPAEVEVVLRDAQPPPPRDQRHARAELALRHERQVRRRQPAADDAEPRVAPEHAAQRLAARRLAARRLAARRLAALALGGGGGGGLGLVTRAPGVDLVAVGVRELGDDVQGVDGRREVQRPVRELRRGRGADGEYDAPREPRAAVGEDDSREVGSEALDARDARFAHRASDARVLVDEVVHEVAKELRRRQPERAAEAAACALAHVAVAAVVAAAVLRRMHARVQVDDLALPPELGRELLQRERVVRARVLVVGRAEVRDLERAELLVPAPEPPPPFVDDEHARQDRARPRLGAPLLLEVRQRLPRPPWRAAQPDEEVTRVVWRVVEQPQHQRQSLRSCAHHHKLQSLSRLLHLHLLTPRH
mmetsp:Transcript_29204/g.100813  ORF Transcript_29204/g.100813 Transcript_29204/m.100813 type:complete len:581 (-) Transcript_29204:59-1801(-)